MSGICSASSTRPRRGSLASGLIPSSEDSAAREWRGVRTYPRSGGHHAPFCCEGADAPTQRELWRLLTVSAPSVELRPLVAGTPAQPFLEPENARMFGSIRAVAGFRPRRRSSMSRRSGRAGSRSATGCAPVREHCSCPTAPRRSRRCARSSPPGCDWRSSRGHESPRRGGISACGSSLMNSIHWARSRG